MKALLLLFLVLTIKSIRTSTSVIDKDVKEENIIKKNNETTALVQREKRQSSSSGSGRGVIRVSSCYRQFLSAWSNCKKIVESDYVTDWFTTIDYLCQARFLKKALHCLMYAAPLYDACCKDFMDYILANGSCADEDDKEIDKIENQVCSQRK